MGLKFSRASGFLKRGYTVACLKEDGKMPLDSEQFIIVKISS